MNKKIIRYLNNNISDLFNSNILIFGGTGKIGEAIVEELIYLNAHVILAVRNENKAHNLINRLKAKYPNLNIDLINFDLSCFTSFDKLNLKDLNITNVIINSAVDSKDINNSYMINCLMPYQIIKRFKGINTIITSSISYKKNDDKDYYSIHKRELMQLCYSLNNDGYNITLAHPGIVYTDLFCKRNKKYKFIFPILRLFMPSPYKAALNMVYALDKAIDINMWIGPNGFFEVFGYPKIRKLKKKFFEYYKINLAKEHIIEKEKKYGL